MDGARENIFCFKNVKKYMFINPQTKDFVPKSSGTGKIDAKADVHSLTSSKPPALDKFE